MSNDQVRDIDRNTWVTSRAAFLTDLLVDPKKCQRDKIHPLLTIWGKQSLLSVDQRKTPPIADWNWTKALKKRGGNKCVRVYCYVCHEYVL